MSLYAKAAEVGLEVEDVMRVEDAQSFRADEEADLVVVGLGGAGLAASLEGLERGLSVIAVDRYEGGGSTAANGGVFYAGGGTSIQKAAGEDDSPEEMLAYLKMEAGEVVSEDTLKRFVAESIETVEWLMKHGGKFDPSVWKEKSSYPPLDKFLYHPDNSLAASYRKIAKPAARGHRAYHETERRAQGSGKFITGPLTRSALALGLRFLQHTEARQLIVDQSGRVVGVRVLSIPDGSAEARAFAKYTARAEKLIALLPGALPFASATFALGRHYLQKAREIEHLSRVEKIIRARKGVVLSAGGFIMNPRMVSRYAPAYKDGTATGTLGDQGSGIMLGMSAGGATALMGKISAWRFINPPKVWAESPIVNRAGKRFVNEVLYGATLGEAIVEKSGGKAWLIFDRKSRDLAAWQGKDPRIPGFQRVVTQLNLAMNARKAPSLGLLADKIGINGANLVETIREYNDICSGARNDELGKDASECTPVETAPFYAMDISIDSKYFPLSVMSFGGLKVDESTGEVLNGDGHAINGLYAAGRCAVGVASQTYVSGLSFADCVFSGRRAARHAAGG